jgi:hypothetical protein
MKSSSAESRQKAAQISSGYIEERPKDTIEVGTIQELANIALVETPIEVDWEAFLQFVIKGHRENTSKQIMRYSKKYHHLISTPQGPHKLAELQLLSQGKRKEVMSALANLARFLGLYGGWIQLIRQHDLKWTSFDPESEAAVFRNVFYNQEKGFSSMLDWAKEFRSFLSAESRAFVDFLLLTGLRPDEACKSINLLKQGHENYLNKETGVLEHFQFPKIFIRKTKKCYVSVVTDPLLSAIAAVDGVSDSYYEYSSKLRSEAEKNGYIGSLPIKNLRKIHGTWLRMNGIESETVDLLQGRTASSVFARHYFRPDFSQTCAKVKELTEQLHAKINNVISLVPVN